MKNRMENINYSLNAEYF